MTVLVVTNFYPPYYLGGFELNCKNHVDYLRSRGHKVFVLTSTYGLKQNTIEDNIYRVLDQCDVEGLKKHRSKWLCQIYRYASFRRNSNLARKIAHTIKPDIIYAWNLYDISLTTIKPFVDTGVPIVYTIADYNLLKQKKYFDPTQPFLRRLARYLLTGIYSLHKYNFNNFIYISEHLKNEFELERMSPDNNYVVHRGMPEALIERSSGHILANSQHPRLVYAGRLDYTKGVHVAISACALLQKSGHPTITLDIIGSGSRTYQQDLTRLIRDTGVEGSVNFISMLPHAELLRILSQYTILLFPSIWQEPFGLLVIEAMALGLPVIASRVGGVREIITHGVDGILVEPNNEQQLASAVRTLLEDKGLYKKIAMESRVTVSKRFLASEEHRCCEQILLACSRAKSVERDR